MVIKYTKGYLDKLENIFASSEYHLRYEKGNFKSGYCILRDNKIVIINKYFTQEGKINALVDILKTLDFNPQSFDNQKQQNFLKELKQTELKL